MKLGRILFTILFACIAINAMCQDLFVVPKVTGMKFDGNPEEDAIKKIEPLPLTQHTPVLGGEISDKSIIRMAYDEDYLYFTGVLYYPNEQDIRNTSRKRDYFDYGIDFFGVTIDSFNDNENALGFFTAPSGLRLDFTVFNDGQGDQPVSGSWNTFWDVKSTLEGNIWRVEMRIPFTSLRFQDQNGEVTMGIIVQRYSVYNSETITFPEVPNDRGDFSSIKPSSGRKVLFTGIKSSNPLYIAPYVSGGFDQQAELDADGNGYHKNDNWDFGLGVDVKYNVGGNLTIDATVNPDFAQVEADDQVVNLTRFSLFFPEKRLFFQERASLFDFRLGGPNTLFYSRKIGINEDLEKTVPIYGGLRAIGRIGNWDIGLIDMQTAPIDTFATANSGILRVKKRVFNENSYLGIMATNLIDGDGNYNTAAGMDGLFKVVNNDFFEFNYVQTFENNATNKAFSLDNAKLRFNWQKRSVAGFGYDLSWHRAGMEYNPALGFELRENVTRWGADLWYGWMPAKESKIFLHQPRIKAAIYRKNGMDYTETGELGVSWKFQAKTAAFLIAGYNYQTEYLADTFELSDEVYVPPGKYDYHYGQVMFLTSPQRRYSAFGDISVGSFYDGSQIIASISPLWKISPTLDIGGDYIFNYAEFNKRSQTFIAHVGRLRTTLAFSSKVSLSAFVQVNTADNITIGNIRFRYNPREGNDFYFVYNEILNNRRNAESPRLLGTDNRTILLKYTYTFSF